MTRRGLGVIGAGLVLLLAVAQVTYWKLAAERLKTDYAAWVAARVHEGWNVQSGAASIGGWPRNATLNIQSFAARPAGTAIARGLHVAAADLALSVPLVAPTSLRVSVTGPIHLQAGAGPDTLVTSDRMALLVPLTTTGPEPSSLTASNLRIEAATGAWHVVAGLLNAQIELSDTSLNGQVRPIAFFSLSSEAIALPATIKWPLGRNISSVVVDGKVLGPFPDQSHPARWAKAWRDGGGSVDIRRLTMGWGPLGLTGSAKLQLDDQLQPMGTGSGKFVGYEKALDQLAEGAVLTKSAATVVKAVLSLIAQAGDDGSPGSVDVPLTLQYRTLSMRQVPLLRVPELDWPAQ